MKNTSILLSMAFTCAFLSSCTSGIIARQNQATASRSEISSKSYAALNDLYRSKPEARMLANNARAVLVFPEISKAGFIVAGMGGNGALLRPGGVAGYYQTAGLSYGFQAGAQKYGYALFLMDDAAVRNLNLDSGWEIGGAPSIVVIDDGWSGSLSTRDLNKSAYAMFFNQKGLMGGLGLQGSKITKIHPENY
jgi:lipid-binding SYLF domain-containing protein